MKQILTIIGVSIISFIGSGVIILNFDPFKASIYIKFLFLSSLTTFVWSIATAVFFYLPGFSHAKTEKSFSVGFLISVIILFIILGLRAFSI